MVWLEDEPGALNRVVNLFRRRSYNIESLSVGHTEEASISRMTLVVRGEDAIIEQCTKQLYKLLEVIKVTDVTDDSILVREMALSKLPPTSRNPAPRLCNSARFSRRACWTWPPDAIMVEITGPEEDVERFFALLRRFGIKESVRTGRIAISRGSIANSAI